MYRRVVLDRILVEGWDRDWRCVGLWAEMVSMQKKLARRWWVAVFGVPMGGLWCYGPDRPSGLLGCRMEGLRGCHVDVGGCDCR